MRPRGILASVRRASCVLRRITQSFTDSLQISLSRMISQGSLGYSR
ncbi:hypothetical protein EDF21_2732 [Frigoribacterium sp. PhB118]|nr:hypothetical protein EDF21_2732 [Frigoribacterium sp. PhB118]